MTTCFPFSLYIFFLLPIYFSLLLLLLISLSSAYFLPGNLQNPEVKILPFRFHSSSGPAMLRFDDGLDNEWKGFTVFPEVNPSPNPNYSFNFLVKKATQESEKSTVSSISSSRSSAKEDSFRMVLPPAMPPPRDSTVPLPMFPEPKRTRKKLNHQECILLLRNSLYSKKNFYKEEDFKCNAFCLSLPGLRKHKPARSSKRKDSMEKTKMITASSFTSVEKYEWSHSWTSTTSLTQDSGRSSYFDLPVELLKCCSRGGGKGGRYVQEPATSSFSFDIETEILAMSSVLKTRSSRSSLGRVRDRQRSAETHSNAV